MTCRCRKGMSGERIYMEHRTTSEGLPMSMVSKHYYEWSEQLWMNGTLWVNIMIMIVQGSTSPKWKGWLRRLLSETMRLRWFLFATGKIQKQLQTKIQMQIEIQSKIQKLKIYILGMYMMIWLYATQILFSMGSIMMHYFLQQQTSAWKEKHIRWRVA